MPAAGAEPLPPSPQYPSFTRFPGRDQNAERKRRERGNGQPVAELRVAVKAQQANGRVGEATAEQEGLGGSVQSAPPPAPQRQKRPGSERRCAGEEHEALLVGNADLVAQSRAKTTPTASS